MVKEPPNWYLRYAFTNFKLQVPDFSMKKKVLLMNILNNNRRKNYQ